MQKGINININNDFIRAISSTLFIPMQWDVKTESAHLL
jgi:hypothetical protein